MKLRKSSAVLVASFITVSIFAIYSQYHSADYTPSRLGDSDATSTPVLRADWQPVYASSTITGDLTLTIYESKATSTSGESPRRLEVKKIIAEKDLVIANDTVVMCADCGGMLGDPFVGIQIKNSDSFTVSHYAGSGWRWYNHATFSFTNGEWVLSEFVSGGFHISTQGSEYYRIGTVDDFGKVLLEEYAFDEVSSFVSDLPESPVPPERPRAILEESQVVVDLESDPEISPVVEDNRTEVIGQSVTTAHQESILIGHNTARAGKGLEPLSWSPLVAASAQSWADTLGTASCGMTHSTSAYGENLYYSWTTGELVLNPKDAVKWWLAEEQYYDYETNSCRSGEQCGHYTQIVWEETREIGCGVATCSEPGKETQLWVCQYSPAGNIIGQQPY